jgi:hypothetical protein
VGYLQLSYLYLNFRFLRGGRMNKEELTRALKYTEEKHRNDTVDTFDTNISMMCADVLRVLKNCIEIPEGATNGDMIKVVFNPAQIIKYTSENGYTGVMYGKSSFAIYDKDGKEVLHTGSRAFNTEEELKKQVDGFPEFLEMLKRR